MSVQVTIQDTFNMTLEDLISIAPNSKGAKAIKDLKAEREALKVDNERLREALCAYQREEKASMAKLQAEQALKPTEALKELMEVDDLEEI